MIEEKFGQKEALYDKQLRTSILDLYHKYK